MRRFVRELDSNIFRPLIFYKEITVLSDRKKKLKTQVSRVENSRLETEDPECETEDAFRGPNRGFYTLFLGRGSLSVVTNNE